MKYTMKSLMVIGIAGDANFLKVIQAIMQLQQSAFSVMIFKEQ